MEPPALQRAGGSFLEANHAPLKLLSMEAWARRRTGLRNGEMLRTPGKARGLSGFLIEFDSVIGRSNQRVGAP